MTGLNNIKVKRIISGSIAFMVLVLLFLSSLFIAVEANHHCNDDDCQICECIHQCLNILHGVDDLLPSQTTVLIPVLAILFIVSLSVCDIKTDTPISRKVRLND